MRTNQFHRPLWEFSLALYDQPNVADSCLRLQDEDGINVNILLWCAWLGNSGYLLNQHSLDQGQALIDRWNRQYISPLRALRVQMKADYGVSDTEIERVRSTIKQAELYAERQALYWLEQYAQTSSLIRATDAREAASGNIHLYLTSVNASTNIALVEVFTTALVAVNNTAQ